MNQTQTTEWLTPTQDGNYRYTKQGASGNIYHEETLPATKDLQAVLEQVQDAVHEDGSYVVSDVEAETDADVYELIQGATDE